MTADLGPTWSRSGPAGASRVVLTAGKWVTP
jgi:hypothetical protein